MIAASSASAYGLAEQFPTTERHHRTTTTPFAGRQNLQRRDAQELPRHVQAQLRRLAYFNVYGPRMDIHGLYTEVLIRWMERITTGLPPLIFGDGRR